MGVQEVNAGTGAPLPLLTAAFRPPQIQGLTVPGLDVLPDQLIRTGPLRDPVLRIRVREQGHHPVTEVEHTEPLALP